MAPLVKLAIQILFGSTYTDLSISPEATYPQIPNHEVNELAPLTRSSISLSSVSWGHNRLDVFASGLNDGSVQHKYWDGYQWGPSVKELESLGGSTSSPPIAASWGPNRTDIFIIGQDQGLYHKYWDGFSWSPSQKNWESLGGSLSVSLAIAATSWGPNRLDVFAIGPDDEGKLALWHKYWDGSSWGPSDDKLEHLGGDFISEPAAIS